VDTDLDVDSLEVNVKLGSSLRSSNGLRSRIDDNPVSGISLTLFLRAMN
jgi:hypothetical protein